MPSKLQAGMRLPTMLGKEVRIIRRIGGGGQGDVYEVLYGGTRKALKWYHQNLFGDRASFVHNLKSNILSGAPHESFIWPEDMTDLFDNSFGYVMRLRPDGFVDADEVLLNRVPFPSFRRAVDACLGVVSAFGVLHEAGYSYQDVNTGNFFINPSTGKVLICDNDNVAPNHFSTGVLGTMGFMAPEILQGEHPSTRSDLYSLGVLVFLLLFRTHPLEGMRVRGSVLDDQTRKKVYGSDALFVFDESDHSNCLSQDVHGAVIALWDCLPRHFRVFLQRAFSQACLRDPRRRPLESEWTRELVRLRSEVITCPRCEHGASAQSELFFQPGAELVCERCGMTLTPRFTIDLLDARTRSSGRSNYGKGKATLPGKTASTFLGYSLPVSHDTRIYRMQTEFCSLADSLDLVAWLMRDRNATSIVGIKNMSSDSWLVREESGRSYLLGPCEIDVVRSGMEIDMHGVCAYVHENR